jgi:uncharacterized protein (TIGR03067 family)
MRTRVLVLLAGLVAVAAWGPASASPIPKHLMKDAGNADQAKLQGKWKLKSIRFQGMDLGGEAAAGIQMTLEIRGDTMTAVAQGHRVTAKFKLDTVDGVKRFASTGGQKQDGDGKPLGKEEDQSFGYAIDGDTLTWAMRIADPNKGPPVDPAKAGADAAVIVFTRVKDKD